ncbi:MAG TPA: hypothetical protein ENK46_14915 [Flavobacteriia bacterium]|nr:hypothetical protein [Flavobacteriia bacterium]
MNFLQKYQSKLYPGFLTIISLFIVMMISQNTYAQKKKLHKVRLKAEYIKITDGEMYLDISATSKIKKKNKKIPNIKLSIYNEFNDERYKVGEITTNNKGKNKFIIDGLHTLKADSTNTYTLKIAFKGNEVYKKASKTIRFKDADIKASLSTKDSIYYIKAILTDKATGNPLANQSLSVQVQRLFSPLRIGKEFNDTDDDGTIVVPIKENIPSADGNLVIEVVLNDSDEYGTVKAFVNAPIGIPVADESTFNQRTMWSPRNKTPIFILVFTNFLIIGIWGILLYLIINLFKISKSKI